VQNRMQRCLGIRPCLAFPFSVRQRDQIGSRGRRGFPFMSSGAEMTMQTLRVPGRKRRPHFAKDVPPQVRRLIWIKWLKQQAESERPFYALSTPACMELAELLAAE